MLSLFKVTILAYTVAFAIGSKHFNINKQIDAILPKFNEHLVARKFQTILLPDFGFSAAPVFIGVTLKDLSTLYRTGDCEIWADGGSLKMKMNVGLKDMVTNIYLVPYMRGSGSFDFVGASAEIGITLSPTGTSSCKTSWDYIKLTTLGTVTTHTANKEFDGKPPPEELNNEIIPYYNKYLNNNEMFSIKHLDHLIDICELDLVVKTFQEHKKLMGA
uniref:Venom protein family 5 protein 1 n=1 Tax=Platymeris rhadamanthus TaxID=1134088 RepID=A0A6B9L687_PLARH|nr:venom protein family 5 protein 1 [Platymeris rhadamanthus]